jgi:hypothetical protein
LKPCQDQNTGFHDHESPAASTGFVTKEENTVSFCFQKKLKQREGLPAAACYKNRGRLLTCSVKRTQSARRRGKLVYKPKYEAGMPRMKIRRVNITAFWGYDTMQSGK